MGRNASSERERGAHRPCQIDAANGDFMMLLHFHPFSEDSFTKILRPMLRLSCRSLTPRQTFRNCIGTRMRCTSCRHAHDVMRCGDPRDVDSCSVVGAQLACRLCAENKPRARCASPEQHLDARRAANSTPESSRHGAQVRYAHRSCSDLGLLALAVGSLIISHVTVIPLRFPAL